jgi:tetratricopeptide (TPR) repeat protein
LGGLIYSRKGQYKSAVTLIKEAVRLAPDYGLFRFKLAENRLYLEKDADDDGIFKGFIAALELMDDEDGRMAFYAGNLYANFGNDQNAAVFYKTALSALPDNEEYVASYYRCLERLKKFHEAEDLLAQVKKRNPSPDFS